MATEQINKEVDQLKNDIAALRADMSSLVKTLKDVGIDKGREYYDQATDRAHQASDTVRKRANDTYSAVGKEVEEHPLTSVLTAFGTGFVVGMLLDRRH